MKKFILPAIAALLVLVAAVVIVVVPKKGAGGGDGYANLNGDGDVVIKTADLSQDKISFIKYAKDSKIELISVLGEDGNAYAALGTCQSCNGSPGAYYTQEGDHLKCNNCGLTFPLEVIGTEGSGCHPIMIDDAGVQRTEDGLVISKAALLTYEPLFDKVASH